MVIILLLLEKPPCQVVQRRGVKSPFQLQPKFLYQIRGEALILGLQDIHPVASERFSAVLSARFGSFSYWPMNLGMERRAFAAGVFFSEFAITRVLLLLQTSTPSA